MGQDVDSTPSNEQARVLLLGNPNNHKLNKLSKLWSGILDVIGLGPTDDKERAKSVNQLWEILVNQLDDMGMEGEGWYWPVDIYVGEEGEASSFAIVTREGLLFRMSSSMSDGRVMFGEPEEVTQSFNGVGDGTTSRTTIRRQEDGQWRFVSVMATSVLNKDAEIDSQALFDDMIERAKESGAYPYRTVGHGGENLRTGQYDFLTRVGNCYIGSGLYDDSELARVERAALQKDPEKWGESIRYFPLSKPDMIWFDGDIGVPVYQSGIHIETSVLRQTRACNYFTSTVLTKEVERMSNGTNEASLNELRELLRTAGYKDDEADAFIQQRVNGVNREIDLRQMISRQNGLAEVGALLKDGKVTQEQVTAVLREMAEGEESTEETETQESTEESADEDAGQTIVMSDELIAGIARQVSEILVPTLNERIEEIVTGINNVAADVSDLGATVGQVQERTAKLEGIARGDAQDIAAHLPPNNVLSLAPVRLIRPSAVNRSDNGGAQVLHETSEAAVQDGLDLLPNYPV